MKSREIRHTFLEYFRENGHEVVQSSSLVPKGDPTLLFTNAGMVQFKGVFLGEEKRGYARAATCQKCMRAGGKHSDIENVGHTRRHHTFFEMLGNFSFGDYFKREAIRFSWDLLTVKFKLPADRFWVSVYEADDEAGGLWREEAGVDPGRIVRLGAKDNFWQMADTGPCGPCSEIIIDQGPEAGCGRPECKVGCDCDRYLELWNLVFMQYNRDESGKLTPLPRPSIDTGMGIERIAAVLQGKGNNFDTDLFSGIISSIEAHSKSKYGSSPATDTSIRVIADHLRASAFLMADGLMPSNEGRGYVLRRVIRRASRHLRLLGVSGAALYKMLGSVSESMGDIYPELMDELARSEKLLRFEEERFLKTLDQGITLLDGVINTVKSSGGNTIPGEEIFKLYDTFGFPLDLVKDIARDSLLDVDERGFHEAMEAQRERARASWVGEEEAVGSIYKELSSELGPTEFVGYEELESDSVLKALVKGGRVVKELVAGEEGEVFLDKTPFYGESGGQVGDTGHMSSEGARAAVLDTLKPLEGMHSHKVRVEKGALRVWDRLRCRVDTERRTSIKRNHTATHLLQAALRSVVGDHVRQAGSLVEPGRLRFDFTHFTGLTREELTEIEDIVTWQVLEDLPVETKEMDIDTAISSGAMALFGEKYGDRVRTVGVADFSRELCGGTHCRRTGEIGTFIIDSEGSVAAGIRRIEAITGTEAVRHIRGMAQDLSAISGMLKADSNPTERVASLLEEMKAIEKENERLKGAAAKDVSRSIVESARDISGVKVISYRTDGLDPKDLRGLADAVRDRIGSGVIVLASALDGQASILAAVTKDLTAKLKAGDILKKVAEAAGGRGGGRPDMAQGGTKDISKLDTALESVYDIIKGMA